jgi:hypothetical protein
MPIEKDAILGVNFLVGLTQIEAHTGQAEEAVKHLRQLLTMPAGEYISLTRLKIGRTMYRAIRGRDPACVGLAWGYARSAVSRRPRHPELGFCECMRSNQSPRNSLSRAREVSGKGLTAQR